MNERLENALSDLVERLDGAAGSIGGEIPAVIEQLLTWHFVYAVSWFVFGGLGLFVSWWLIGLLKKKHDEAVASAKDYSFHGNGFFDRDGDPLDAGFFAMIGIALLALVSSLIAIFSLHDVAMILIAPDLYVVEYLRDIAK